MGIELLTAFTHWVTLATSVMAAIALAWIVYSTQSSYMLRVRLWKLVHGEAKSDDPEIQAFFEEQSTLMFFRFTQTAADDIDDMKRYIEWSKSKKIPLWLVRNSKNYFDKENLCINANDVKSLGFNKGSLKILSALLVLIAIPMFFVLLSSQAIVRFNATNQWFLLGPDSAHVLFAIDEQPLTKGQCTPLTAEDISRSKFKGQAADFLCKSWASDDVASYIKNTVDQQRKGSAWFLFLLTIFTFNTWNGALKAEAAEELYRRLLKSEMGDADTAEPYEICSVDKVDG